MSGRQILCPGPGHSLRDRSLAIRFDSTAPDGFVVHSFAGQDWRECRDHVRAILGLGDAARPSANWHEFVLNDDAKRTRANHLWDCRQSAADTVVETYLYEARGYRGAIPDTIGFLPPGAYQFPAMIAAFGPAYFDSENLPHRWTAVAGIHLTFLEPDGSGKAAIDRPKIMLGPSSGFPIVVAQPNDLLGLAITEGIEDALSVHAATGLGAWAAGSAGGMPGLADKVPDYIEAVTICAHDDDAGRRGAYALAEALTSRGFETFIQGIET